MRKGLKLIFVIIFFALLGLQAQEFSITIDAEKDAWYGQLSGTEDGLINLPAACYLTDIGSGPPENDDDLSAFVWMAYDSVYLYLYTEVKDDVVNGSNGARYLNDCIELKFDPEPSEGGTYTEILNTRLTALGDAGVGGIDNLTGLPGYIPEEGVDYARKITDDGYALEFRMPIENIEAPDGRSLYFNETGKMGLAINIGDNDSGTRDNMLQWSAGHADAAHSDLKLLGAVTFFENHKLGFEAVSIIDPTIVNENADEWYTSPTSIENDPIVTESYAIVTNYPNPFNPETTIRYQIKNAGSLTLAIYNINGDLINKLVDNKHHQPGTYELNWNGKNISGQLVSSGIYFCRLISPTQIISNKMMLVR